MVLKIDDKINILKIYDKIMMGMLTNDVLTRLLGEIAAKGSK